MKVTICHWISELDLDVVYNATARRQKPRGDCAGGDPGSARAWKARHSDSRGGGIRAAVRRGASRRHTYPRRVVGRYDGY
jgi:hypothetical protein